MSRPLRKGDVGQPGHPGQFAKGRFTSADEGVGFEEPSGGCDPPARDPALTSSREQAVASRVESALSGEGDVEVMADDEHPLIRAQAVDAPGLPSRTEARLAADPDVRRVMGLIMR